MCRYSLIDRGGSSRPPEQTNGTTGQSNRKDSDHRHLPEETFTIRTWGRQTLSPELGAAPARVAAANISASSPEVCLSGSLVTPDQREVCTLAREVMLSGKDSANRPFQGAERSGCQTQPLSAPLQHGIGLLPHPIPAIPSACLAARVPFPLGVRDREDNRLTTFRRCTRVGKVASLRRWHGICAGGVRSRQTWPRTFWSKRISILRLFV